MPVVAAIGGALIQASAASKAAKAQTNAANKDIAFQTETRDMAIERAQPFYQSGLNAQNAYNFELGLGDRPMIGGTAPTVEEFTSGGSPGVTQNALGGRFGGFGATQGTQKFRVNGQVFNTMQEAQAFASANKTGATAYGGYTKAPGYDYRLKQGQDSLEAGAAARGGLYSGAAMQALQENGQNFASNEYGQYMNRLAGTADSGLSAATLQNGAGQAAASGVSNALGSIGNAQAAGAVGVGNAINSGIQNGLGIWQYQKQMAAAPMYGAR